MKNDVGISCDRRIKLSAWKQVKGRTQIEGHIKRNFKYKPLFAGGAADYVFDCKFCGTKNGSCRKFHGKYVE